MAAYDLCDLDDVRAFLQKPTADVTQDAIIQAFVTAASKAIINEYEREFAPSSSAGTVRTFEVEISTFPGFLNLAPYDLQAATQIQIDTDATAVTLSTDEYRFFPVTQPDGVYTGIRLAPLTFPSGRLYYPNRRIAVTGTWGFPEIPTDVTQAAAITAGTWLRRDVSAFTTTYNLDESRVERPEAIPSAARAILENYRRMAY